MVLILDRDTTDPKHAESVGSVMNGEDDFEPEPLHWVSFSSEWRLEATIDCDGGEHLSGGGGVDMALLKLPAQRMLQGTQLQYTLQEGEM